MSDEMRLNSLKPAPGAKRDAKRVGRGIGSGVGKTAGRGHKGLKARSGGTVKAGFEGGQMPLHRRLPKKGFSNIRFKTTNAVVNVADLDERFEAGQVINEAALREARLIKGSFDFVKVLGNGEVSKALTLEGLKVSTSAREKIEKAGGSIADSAPAKS